MRRIVNSAKAARTATIITTAETAPYVTSELIGPWVCFGVDEEDGEVGGGVDEPVTGVGVGVAVAGEDKTSTE